jgi:hypothetical protein
MTLRSAFALIALLSALGCSPREDAARTGSASQTVQSLTKPAILDSAAFRLHLDDMVLIPGGWVSETQFAAQDTGEPIVLGESVTDAGLRIRSWLHVGDGYAWVSTNQGMSSPDGPFWISQVESERAGASFDGEVVVGLGYPSASGDSDLVSRSGNLERTISVRDGKISKLILSAIEPPSP